ncbi:hypothetical protein D3C72_2199290 [compost metagenome]
MWRAKHLVQRLQIPRFKLQSGSLGIEPHMLGADRFGDGDHVVLTQNPCQRDLCRRHVVSDSHLFEGGVGEHFSTLTDRAVSHDRQPLLLAPG